MAHIFISYARKDHFFVDRLRGDLRRAGIDYWIDREGLSPGTPSWERAIRDALRGCESVLWIVSPDSFESPYMRDEISIALLYRRRIYPVFAKGDNWLECVPLGKGEIQYIDARTDYDGALKRIIEALSAAVSPYVMPEEPIPELPGDAEPRNPYKGLNAFTEKDAGDFFGRDELVEKLHTRITDTLKRKGDRLLAVLGPSGAGKSSVVMAGLIPALKKAHSGWAFLPRMAPGKHPAESLADALYDALPDKSLSTIESDLSSPGGRMLHRLAQQIHSEQVVLYIDQFEELFTQTEDERERQQFISLIVQAATEPDGRVIVLLSMRADFYGHPLNYPQLGRLIEANNVGVLPMSITELRDAIEKPARLPDVGLTFVDGLVAEIIFALRDRKGVLAGALPLLEFTLTRLFTQRDGTRLTFAAYHAMGGVDGAIGKHCEAVFCRLTEAIQNRLSAVFLPLVSFDEQTGEPTRRRAPLAIVVTDADARALVDVLVKERLLQTGRDGDSVYLEVAHEALFHTWGRLATWVETARGDLALFRQYERDARVWADRSQDSPPPTHEALVYFCRALENLGMEWEPLPEPLRSYTEPEAPRLLRELDTLPKDATSHERRRDIGDRLAVIGDTRPGVGVTDGLPDMLWLPVGGSNGKIAFKDENGKVYGTFEVRPFYIARYLVTYPQFQAFVEADDGFENDDWWEDMPDGYRKQALSGARSKLANAPRDSISWYQSVAFARWMNHRLRGLRLVHPGVGTTPASSAGTAKTDVGTMLASSAAKTDKASLVPTGFVVGENAEIRLPTEWEWQWAAMNGIEGREYPWPGGWQEGCANTHEAGLSRTTAVGMYPHGAAACGALDLAGNLWEWCANNKGKPEIIDAANTSSKVLRGGSFFFNRNYAAASYRDHGFAPYFDNYFYGVRLVLAAPISAL